MKQSIATVYYFNHEQYLGHREVIKTSHEYEEAQCAMPEATMWMKSGSNWVWWYNGEYIHHWRVAHPDVKSIPAVLPMMELTGAI